MNIERIEAPELDIDKELSKYDKVCPGVVRLDQRQRNERSILWSIIHFLRDRNWLLDGVFDGDEATKTSDAKEVMELAFNLDEVYVHFRLKDTKQGRVIWFIWDNGNEGRDCITDCSGGPFGDLVEQFIDKIEEKW